MSSSESSHGRRSPPKKYRKQKFRPIWLDESEFKGWLEEIPKDKYKCRCSACGKILNCGKSELSKHSLSKIHKKNVVSLKNAQKIDMFTNKQHKAEDPVKNFEMRISMFFAEHNVAFQVVDHLIPLLKEIVPDSEILKKCRLGRTKCTKIIQNILAEEEKSKLISKLRKYNFSALVDGSTDISSKKSLCVLVKFFDEESEKITVQLLDLIPVGTDGTAKSLYTLFKNTILSYSIPFDNVVGVGSDGENTMVGKNDSFVSHFLEDNPHSINIKCICHSAALIANKACMELPRAPEELIRQIGTYISGSSKRCTELEEFQVMMKEEKRRILRTSETRWLSRQKCIERILHYWNVLIEYFKSAHARDKLKSAEWICAEFSNVCNKAYLLFLKYALNYLNELNALFQSKKILVHVLHSESVKIFLKLGQNCIKKTELKTNCIVRSPHVSLPIQEVFLGPECEEFLKQLPEKNMLQIKMDCLKFYIKALEEIQNRLPLKTESLFKEMEFLNPMAAFGENKEEFKFFYLCQKFDLNLNELTQEWRSLGYSFSKNEIKSFEKIGIVQFWCKIMQAKNFNDNFIFPNLSKLVKKPVCITSCKCGC